MASVLCCTTDIFHFVSEPNLRHLDCLFSSPLGLWDLSLPRHANVNNLVDELRLGQLNCLLRQPGLRDLFACSCGTKLRHCDGLFQIRQWHKHIDDLFDDSLWDMLLARELRLQTTVFAGVFNVTKRIMWLPFLYQIPKRKSLRPSPSKTVCFLISVLSLAERSFLSILISLYFIVQSSCCSCGVLATGTSTNVLKQWDIHRSLCFLNHKHLSLHYRGNVRSVLFEILLGCGKGLPLVERHRGCLWLLR